MQVINFQQQKILMNTDIKHHLLDMGQTLHESHVQSEDESEMYKVPKTEDESEDTDVKRRKIVVKLEEGETEIKTENAIKVCYKKVTSVNMVVTCEC